jgi:pyruvate/2-oxoglutarate dehydrogenase complex dihydrolipoamide dehydrogenase (E3) component
VPTHAHIYIHMGKHRGYGGLGGTCVNVGCVPKKLMVYGAHYARVRPDAMWQRTARRNLEAHRADAQTHI